MKKVIASFFILLIRGYQYLISPFLGANCRFNPTCSQYAIECFKKYNVFKAIFKSTWRILRCHPWNSGGNDPA